MASRPRIERAVVFGDRGSASYPRLFARTARSLRRMGIEATELDHAALQRGSVWLVRAGAFLNGAPPSLPEPSATGRPLCAVGRITHGHADDVDAWSHAHAKTGGDLSALSADDLPPVASVLLAKETAHALTTLLSRGASTEDGLREVVGSDVHRAVRLPTLDVQDDPGLRAIVIVTSLQQGGAERIALDLARGLGRSSVQTLLVALGRTSRRMLPIPDGVVVRVPRTVARADRLREAGALAVDFGADVLSTHLLGAEDLRVLAETGIPAVVTVHNARIAWPVGLASLRRRHASLLLACAQSVEADVRAALSERVDHEDAPHVRTVWNGVSAPSAVGRAKGEMRRSLEIPAEAVLLLAIANPRTQKRLHLLPAIARATESLLSRAVHVVIAGAPSSDDDSRAADAALREAIRTEQREQRVRILGSVDDVSTLHAAADVLVSPSAWEGLSLAQLEALAAGLPIVTTAVGGAPEVAARTTRISLVPADAEPDHYAQAIATQLQAREPATLPTDFTTSRMVERHRALLRRVAPRRSRTTSSDAGVYFVMNNVSVGGAQSSARRLALGLHERGMRVRFAVLQEREDNTTPGLVALREAGIPVFIPPPSRDPAISVEHVLDDLDREPTRALLFWNAIAEHQVLLADANLHVPMIEVSPGEMLFSSMSTYFERPRPGLPYRSGTELGRRLSATVVKYAAEAERAASFFGAPVHVIPNGVPLGKTPASRARNDGPLVLGTAARISPQKKLVELFDALHLCHHRMPPYELRIAGAPERGAHDHMELLRARADGLPVSFVGERVPVRPFLEELDLFVMISEPAGCPNASLEAMAAGLPIVATSVGGAIDQIARQETGLLSPPADATALADAIVDAVSDRERLLAWGAAGRRRAECLFDVARMVDDYTRLIDLVSA